MESTPAKQAPLTAAERKRTSRERAKLRDPHYQRLENKRCEETRKRRVQNMSQGEVNRYRERAAQRQKECRRCRKEGAVLERAPRGFQTRQALARAVNRVLAKFPVSPGKKAQTFSGVARRVSLDCQEKMAQNLSGQGVQAISGEVKESVCAFYFRPDIVWTAPGMKDEITVWENKTKTKLRKYYLTMYLKEAFKLFQEAHPTMKIGFSKFCEMRPKNVLLMKDTPADQCKCQKHENVIYMLKGLQMTYSNDMWGELLCDDVNVDGACWKGSCVQCQNGKKLECEMTEEEVFWKEWYKDDDGRLRLQLKSASKGDLFETLIQEMPSFQEHVRVKRIQADAFHKDKLDHKTSVLQCDFAMAYSCEYQTEVQSALWSRESVNLFTAAFYHGNSQCKPYLIVTNSQNKNKDTVYTFMRRLVSLEKEHLKESFIIYTDGPSGEFKNRYMVKMPADLNKCLDECTVMWKYFATSHGKGVVDGIEGSAKSLVRKSVMSRGDAAIVQSATDFFKEVSQLMPSVNVQYISQEEIEEYVKSENVWEGVHEVAGIKKTHCIVCNDKGVVSLFVDNSQSDLVTTVSYEEAEASFAEKMATCVTEKEEMKVKDCKKGEWVIVTYDGKLYPGEVTAVCINGLRVSVMRPTFAGSWKWPERKDEIFYSMGNIVQKINPPYPTGTRGQFNFEHKIY